MKIQVGYTKKSIDKAIKQIDEYQKRLKNIIPTFIQQCADKIVAMANERLNYVGLDYGVVAEIKNGWQPLQKVDDNNYVLLNTADESVYIEFGVGQVGAGNPHDLAGADNYQYDVNHHGAMGWEFKKTNGNVDILEKYRLYDDGLIIRTVGQPATMFVFNAVQDFKDKNLGEPIWQALIKGLFE
jgi:hypothetical protein